MTVLAVPPARTAASNSSVASRPTVAELDLREAPLHVGHRPQRLVADEDDEVTGLGGESASTVSISPAGSGVQESGKDVGVKCRPERECIEEVVNGRMESFDEVPRSRSVSPVTRKR